ncbi:hypothetical protein SY83_09410 [Paenibacillus swuensis]|uniref:SH3b domain-containing protein n=1 Tax=Paenibacillus swuensis TaxID=1178515 RepID=A0A172THL9_9BACL|nr:SH3 domain-containing protein [Paenibacillus swuensis]ANE46456.1 hypothetical protein SY83_09410 [Paenibacillus swuensis]
MINSGNFLQIIQTQNPTLLEALQEGIKGYLIIGFIASILLVYIVVPMCIWLLSQLRGRLIKVLAAFVRLLAYMVDFLFIFFMRIFRVKKIPNMLDFNGDWLSNYANKQTVNRHAFIMSYKNKRKKVALLIIAFFISFFTLSDRYRWYEKSVAVEKIYLSINDVFTYADGLKEQLLAENSIAVAVENVTITYIKLNKGEPMGNIRSEGSLSAEQIGVAKAGETLEFLQEEKKDGKRIWYKVRTAKGQVGWISGAISSKVEVVQSKP